MENWTYKPLSDDERLLELWAQSGMHAFRNEPHAISEYLKRMDRDECCRVLLDEHGDLLATLARTQIGMFVNGGRVAGEAVGFVTVPPIHRGRRASVRVMHEHFREAHDCGSALSVLYSARARLYRGVGYECAGRRSEIELPIRTLRNRKTDGVEGVSVREMTREDRGEIERVYTGFAQKINGYLDRGDWHWEYLLGGYAKNRRPGFVFERDGVACGYMILTHGDPIGTKQGCEMEMHDFAFLDAQAARSMVRFLTGFASTRGSITIGGDSSHPFFDHIDELWYRVKRTEHWMIRILDLQRAISQRGFSPCLRGKIVLGIEDPIMHHNTGVWRLHVHDGVGVIEPTDEHPEITMGIDALAPIYTGFMSATQMGLNDRVTGSPDAISMMDGLFSAITPAMADDF